MRAGIYDLLITGMTAGWYAEVLRRLPEGARMLDVGIGTGKALLANQATIRDKRLRVDGIDIDATYVEACRQAIGEAGLDDQVSAELQSVYDHQGGPYDAIYFSASFMLLPDPVAALRHVAGLLDADGVIYSTQTLEHERSPWMETLKPLLRYLTSIDFGQVTYETDLLRTLETGDMEVLENTRIESGRSRSAHLIAMRPRRAG